MKNSILKDEIKNNIREIIYRLKILKKLTRRYFFQKGRRVASTAYAEYDCYWEGFWENRDIFRKDLPFQRNNVPISPGISPFQARKEGIIRLLADKISEYGFRSILEIGAGAGLNLMMLAPLFPNVQFFGLEPTESGVRVAKQFIDHPPPEFEEAWRIGPLRNVQVLRGSILDPASLGPLKDYEIDLVYTVAVLEQIYNSIETAFENIFALCNGMFLFYEEWLEANQGVDNYMCLVDNDYFRLSWNYLNKIDSIEVLERTVPPIQPAWLKYGVVFCRKKSIFS